MEASGDCHESPGAEAAARQVWQRPGDPLHSCLDMIAIILLTISNSMASPIPTGGTYTFPAPDGLKSVATWPLKLKKFDISGDHVMITYLVPGMVVGPSEVAIELVGTAKGKFFKLKGPHAKAVCLRAKANLFCMVEMRALKTNQKDVEKFLAGKVTDPTELKQRMQVAQAFGTEPIGILQIPTR